MGMAPVQITPRLLPDLLQGRRLSPVGRGSGAIGGGGIVAGPATLDGSQGSAPPVRPCRGNAAADPYRGAASGDGACGASARVGSSELDHLDPVSFQRAQPLLAPQ